MIFVPICSVTAFIVILADLNWKWVSASSKVEFAHSIFGIVTIGLSIIQVEYFNLLKNLKKILKI